MVIFLETLTYTPSFLLPHSRPPSLTNTPNTSPLLLHHHFCSSSTHKHTHSASLFKSFSFSFFFSSLLFRSVKSVLDLLLGVVRWPLQFPVPAASFFGGQRRRVVRGSCSFVFMSLLLVPTSFSHFPFSSFTFASALAFSGEILDGGAPARCGKVRNELR